MSTCALLPGVATNAYHACLCYQALLTDAAPALHCLPASRRPARQGATGEKHVYRQSIGIPVTLRKCQRRLIRAPKRWQIGGTEVKAGLGRTQRCCASFEAACKQTVQLQSLIRSEGVVPVNPAAIAVSRHWPWRPHRSSCAHQWRSMYCTAMTVSHRMYCTAAVLVVDVAGRLCVHTAAR